MASTLVQQYMHIVFHTKCTSITMREEDLGRIFDYVGGIIHNKQSFVDEYKQFLDAYHVEYDERYAFED